MDPPAVAANPEGRRGSFTRARGSGGRVVRELQAKSSRLPAPLPEASACGRDRTDRDHDVFDSGSSWKEWMILTYNESARSDC